MAQKTSKKKKRNDDDDDDDEEDPAADVDDGRGSGPRVRRRRWTTGQQQRSTTGGPPTDSRAGGCFVERWIDETDDESEPSLFSIRGDLESCVEERRTTLRGSDGFRLSKATWAQN